jgi:molybdenum cofactor biosynthesis enzyme
MIIEESLKLINEGQALTHLHKLLAQVDEVINVYQKEFDGTLKKEEKALETENFVELKEAKTVQIDAVNNLIKVYRKKLEYLEKIHSESTSELGEIKTKGIAYFSNKSINEIENTNLKKGDKLKISSVSSEMTVEKYGDINSYKILSTNINGLEKDFFVKLPEVVKIGHPAKITAYKSIGGKFEEIGSFSIQTVMDIVKNPS